MAKKTDSHPERKEQKEQNKKGAKKMNTKMNKKTKRNIINGTIITACAIITILTIIGATLLFVPQQSVFYKGAYRGCTSAVKETPTLKMLDCDCYATCMDYVIKATKVSPITLSADIKVVGQCVDSCNF